MADMPVVPHEVADVPGMVAVAEELAEHVAEEEVAHWRASVFQEVEEEVAAYVPKVFQEVEEEVAADVPEVAVLAQVALANWYWYWYCYW